jgi:hypothetical protein
LYEPVGKRIIVSRDVIFEESKSWNWSKKSIGKAAESISDSDDDKNNVEVENDNEENENDDNDETTNHHTNNNSDSETNESEETLPTRDRRPPAYLRDYVTNLDNNDDQVQNLAIAMFSSSEDPTTFEEAVKSKTWRNAMETEMKSIEDNNTWKLVDLPQGVKPIGVKWIFNKVQ